MYARTIKTLIRKSVLTQRVFKRNWPPIIAQRCAGASVVAKDSVLASETVVFACEAYQQPHRTRNDLLTHSYVDQSQSNRLRQ